MAKRPSKPSEPAARSGVSPILWVAIGLGVVVLGLLVYLVVIKPLDGGGVGKTVTKDDAKVQRVQAAVDIIAQLCLSSVSESVKNDVTAKLTASLTDGASATGGTVQSRDVLRGAAHDLSESGKLAENARIGPCMERNLDRILDALTPQAEKIDARYKTVLTRFAFKDDGAKPNAAFTDDGAKLRLKGADWVLWNEQSNDGIPIGREGDGKFVWSLQLPAQGEYVEGTLARELRTEVQGLAPQIARLCFQRAALKPPPAQVYANYDCSPGQQCKLDSMSPRWLDDVPCKDDQQAAASWLTLVPAAHAQEGANGWAIPSLETWQKQVKAGAIKGIGLTELRIESDAFADPRIYAVEVAVWLNGKPVLVDGLQAHDRPVRKFASEPFSYTLGFRSLDLQGQDGGCDKIEISLKPLGGDGARSIKLGGDIVALRPLPAQKIAVPGGHVGISTVYRRPQQAYEMELFLESVLYGSSFERAAEAQRLKVRETIMAEKRAFDALGLSYRGNRLIAVVRPPLRKPTYAIAVGLRNAQGQVSFTFPKKDGEISVAELATYLSGERAKRRDVARVIRPVLSQYTVGTDEVINIATPPGICRGFAPVGVAA